MAKYTGGARKRENPSEEEIYCLADNRQAIVSFPADLTLAELGHITTQLTTYIVKAKHDSVQQHGTDSRDSC